MQRTGGQVGLAITQSCERQLVGKASQFLPRVRSLEVGVLVLVIFCDLKMLRSPELCFFI